MRKSCFANHKVLYLLALLFFAGSCATLPGTGRIGTLRVSGSEVWLNQSQAQTGMSVSFGDRLTTGDNSSVIVDFTSGGFIQLDENTDPLFEWLEQAKCILIRIVRGQVYVDKEKVCIDDANAHLVLNSAANLEVQPGLSTITVVQGSVTLLSPQQATIRYAQQARVSPRRIEGPFRELSQEELRSVVRWRERYTFAPIRQRDEFFMEPILRDRWPRRAPPKPFRREESPG